MLPSQQEANTLKNSEPDCLPAACTELRGHWRLFVSVCLFFYIQCIFSGYVCYIKLTTLIFWVHVKVFYCILSSRFWRVQLPASPI